MGNYKEDREKSNNFLSQIEQIIGGCRVPLGRIFEIQQSTVEEDIKYATDGIVRAINGASVHNIAYRIRDWRFRMFYDLTIRSKRDTGTKTELEKILEGHCDFYFYGYAKDNVINEWFLSDIDKMRKSKMFENRPSTSNYDGTYFIGIPFPELELKGCIIDKSLADGTFYKKIIDYIAVQ